MRPATPEDIEDDMRRALDEGNAELVDSLGKMLDRLGVAHPTTTMLSAALWYAQQGLWVFPLQAGSKVPLVGSHGFEDATTDAALIDWWLHKYPESNVGIATGH